MQLRTMVATKRKRQRASFISFSVRWLVPNLLMLLHTVHGKSNYGEIWVVAVQRGDATLLVVLVGEIVSE